jgi:alanine racemase
MTRAEIVVDVAAVRHNVRLLKALTGTAMMTVVKADGYGHGLHQVARAAREAGAEWLGVASLDEAVELRRGGDTGRLLAWLVTPAEDYGPAVRADIDVTAYTVFDLDKIERVGTPARVQLKVDTGLSRGGATMADWPGLVARARAGEESGHWRVTGIWSHLSTSELPEDPANAAQEKLFGEALDIARDAGLRPEVRHLANSAAAILRPSARFDLVRCGIASYGLDPAPGVSPHDLGLVPAMTVRADLALTKEIDAGTGVSYGHTWTALAPTRLGLVPAGYADGVPRSAAGAEVLVGGVRAPLRGTICMDQFVVEIPEHVTAGDDVVLWGPGTRAEPTALDWARWSGTISYEMVTRIGGRMSRRHVDSGLDAGADISPDISPDISTDISPDISTDSSNGTGDLR